LKGRTTVDQIFTVILGKNFGVHNLFNDFKAPCDTVWRNELWSEMHKLSFPPKLVKFCRILSNEIYDKFKTVNTYPLNLTLEMV
jgi:hypothetical protein